MTSSSIKNHLDKDKLSDNSSVLVEQTAQIYAAAKNGMLATIINSVILTIVLWPVISHQILLVWIASIFFVILLRIINAYHYKKASPSQDEILGWAQRFIFGSSIAATIWAASSIWLFPGDDPVRQVFLAFVVGGMAAGAITSLSFIKSAVYIYLCVTLLPLAIRFFISGTELSFAMGSMISLALIVFLQSARESHTKNKQNISMRIDNIKQQQSLNQSEQRYKTLLESATDAFFLHDLDGKLLDVNNQACLSLGYTRDELLTMSVNEIKIDIEIDSVQPDIIWRNLKEGANIRFERIHRRKDGTTFPVEIGLGIIHMENESLISILARDVTERKRVDKMKNEFISTVSHELRTPLTSIRGSLGLMLGGAVGDLPEQAQEMLQVASNNAERLLLLINDILDIQKIESSELEMKFENMDVASFLEQSIKDNYAYADQYGVSFILQPLQQPLQLYANKDRLMQVMANLLSNAAKFSHKGDSVKVLSEVSSGNDCVRISVIDHGDGISEEFCPVLFDKFTQQDSSDTRKKGGTGLGLNISKAIIEKHGGTIGFTSSLNEGSTFYFDLPLLKTNK